MANKRVTEFPVATTVNPSDILLVVQGGVTKQISQDALSNTTLTVDPDDGSILVGKGGSFGKITNPNDVGDDIIVTMGQSNQVGYGTGGDPMLDLPDPRVKQYGAAGTYFQQVAQGIDPLYSHEVPAAGTIGHATRFAREYVRTIPANRTVLIVPTAHGGTGFYTSSLASPPNGYSSVIGGGCWDPTSTDGGFNLAQNAVAQANAALALNPKNRVVAVLWLQGESDSALSQAAYAAKLDALIGYVRANTVGASTVPFLIGQMMPEYQATYPASAGINLAHIDTPRRVLRTAFYYGPTGYDRGDHIHYNAAGQRILARNATAALTLARANVSDTAPVPPAVPTFTQSGTTLSVTWVRTPGRVTDYNVRYSTDSGSTWTTLIRTQSIDNTATITGLTLGATVQVQVRSVNEQGPSAWTASGTITLATIPAQVTGLATGTIGSTQATLTWNAVTGATSYLVEYKTHAASSWTTSSTVATPGATVTVLTPQTSYDFRVSASNVAGTGTPSAIVTASTAAVAPLSTDTGVAFYRAYSLRKVNSAYAGNAITVRRSSDNTTQAIGFAAGTYDLDTAALLAFVGSGSGYVTVLPDQSGNGRDLTQATASQQPRIVNAGVLDTINGHPAMVFDGVDDCFIDSTGIGIYAAGSASALHVVSAPATSTNQVLWGEGGTANANARYMAYFQSSTNPGQLAEQIRDDASTELIGGFYGTVNAWTGAPSQVSTVDTGTAWNTWVGGATSQASAYKSPRSGKTLTLSRFSIGGQILGGSLNFPYAGKVSEIAIFTSALSTAARQAGEANQKNYYGIP